MGRVGSCSDSAVGVLQRRPTAQRAPGASRSDGGIVTCPDRVATVLTSWSFPAK